MTDRETLDDLATPITWRHRFVQWLANLLAVRLYSCPVIVILTNRTDTDKPQVH